ncbi:sodium- and chloride-dependent neutral and basic amino acid transporter B(0+)-like [Heterodontus francisci]|uniref:sodium- and chloride-dependent neutral and basic amino acid transporter B(0+)-like n=1 Tax=Heterodontus francisci TaxID=7792 RepID=UPI00355C5C8D
MSDLARLMLKQCYMLSDVTIFLLCILPVHAPNAHANDFLKLHLTRTTPKQDTTDETETSDENMERGNWAIKTDYLLSMIGYTVGLGNVWRFPFLVYKNGGGVFLIPYTIMLALAGLPIFFMESSLGQFASLGPAQAWKAVPILQGVGLLTVIASTFQGLYYNCIISYCLFYFFVSFQSPLPWVDCYSWWGAEETCNAVPKDPICNFTSSSGSHGNSTTCTNILIQKSRSEHYWDVIALHRSSSIDETGKIVWHLSLCLLLAWLIVLIVLCKGIRFSGKVTYFTVVFPYMGLVLLLIRGITLEGANQGIEFYIGKHSDFSKLADVEVWKDAATQIFYSLSVSLGGITALSSYNKFHNDCFTDAIIVCVVNCGTSVFAGFAIFSILGHMAQTVNVPISEISRSGLGLIFIVYPEAILHLPFSPFWSIIFFWMLFTLGMTSQFAIVETIITSLQDGFPILLRAKRFYLTASVCLGLYFCGLLLVTEAGIYWIHLIDHFCSGWGLLLIAILELIGLSWIYGVNRFVKDVEMMIGEKHWLFWLWWRVCWFFITPIMLTKVFASLKPAPDWGPFLMNHRGERYKDQIERTQSISLTHVPAVRVVKFQS